jgi:transcription antitermination factor NusG
LSRNKKVKENGDAGMKIGDSVKVLVGVWKGCQAQVTCLSDAPKCIGTMVAAKNCDSFTVWFKPDEVEKI